MKVAHADDQPTLVGLGDTQQIREIGPPTDERVAPAKQSKVDSLILGGIAIAVVLAAAALGMGILSYLSSPDAVAGPQGPDGPPGFDRIARSPRCAWAPRACWGSGAGRSEGSNGAHGPARSGWCRRGDWCSGAGWCDRGDWGERHGRREHDDTGNSGALGNRPSCGHERHRHGDLSPRSVCARRWCPGLGAGSRCQERRAAVVVPDEHQRLAGRGIGDRSARRRGTDDGTSIRPLWKGLAQLIRVLAVAAPEADHCR